MGFLPVESFFYVTFACFTFFANNLFNEIN